MLRSMFSRLYSSSIPRSFFRLGGHSATEPVEGIEGAIGNTPLIRIKGLSQQTGCNIFGKAEFMNPGGSVKDRAALWILRKAEEEGKLQKGGTVVEGTAGNTGIGLAHLCRSRGYKLVIYMPETQSPSKVSLLRLLGATVHPVPVVPFTDPKNYNHQARRHASALASEGHSAVWTNQFDNTENRRAHYESTGPEIRNQCPQLDGFTCATGTGGTLAGVAKYLKEQKGHQVRTVLADPPGSVLYHTVKHGKQEREGQGSITEGIGQGRVTANMEGSFPYIDDALHIPDSETIHMVYRLLHQEGLFVGASTALNVVAATKLAQIMGPGHSIVTILCDGAYRYQERLFSRKWLESKDLLHAVPEELRHYIVFG